MNLGHFSAILNQYKFRQDSPHTLFLSDILLKHKSEQ